LFAIVNRTPFAAILVPGVEADGHESVVAIVRATYVTLMGSPLSLAAEQLQPNLADSYYGEAAVSSLRYASDVAPEKPGTDVVLIGAAHAPRGDVVELDVGLEVGSVKKTLRVYGDRFWRTALGLRVTPSKPLPFSIMPLTYERAFCGPLAAAESGAKGRPEPLNPVGRGLPEAGGPVEAKEVPLPNLEDPANLITSPLDRPDPAGFGFIAPHWKWRRRFAGTYDKAWAETKCPLLPDDFNPRFHNAAHPDLVSATPFRGGEAVRITNASRKGTLAFDLPRVEVQAEFLIDGTAQRRFCALDTVVIEPDEDRLTLTWRASVGCHRKIKYVHGVKLTSSRRDGLR
jgi:hypothetical protein